jgi:hypothetical protein
MSKLNVVVKILLLNVLIYSVYSLTSGAFGITHLPDLLSDIKTKEKPKSAFEVIEEGDSTELEKDTLTRAQQLAIQKADTSLISFGDFSKLFESFLSHEYESTAVHIAYFGDSMIEGDLLTSDLRKKMQTRFGGAGVGFMPITSPSASYRTTITHTYNNKWTNFHLNKKPPKKYSLGISGYTFLGDKLASAKFIKNKADKPYQSAHLFYKGHSDALLKLVTDSESFELRIQPNIESSYFTLKKMKPFGKLQIEVQQGAPILYGINLESGPGIYVDNFSFRGHSGTMLTSIPKDNYQTYSEALNCKLVILHYGLNVVGHELGDYSWYKRGIKKAIRHIKSSFPNATILLVSVSDKSYRSNNGYETEPDIPLFVNLQAKIAIEEGICFWNLYKSMGGYNSMKRWVEEEKPRLANLDYTHLNHQGAKRAADIFYQWLIKELESYKKINQDVQKPVKSNHPA